MRTEQHEAKREHEDDMLHLRTTHSHLQQVGYDSHDSIVLQQSGSGNEHMSCMQLNLDSDACGSKHKLKQIQPSSLDTLQATLMHLSHLPRLYACQQTK